MIIVILVVCVIGFTQNAYADNVVAKTNSISFSGQGTGSWKLVATNANQPGGDLVDGCNASPGNPVIVTINTPVGLTANPPSLVYTSCGNAYQSTTFTASSSGTFTVTVSAANQSPLAGSAYQTSPGTITVTVIDSTPPVITYTVNPAVPTGANGWYIDSPTVTWTVIENESPLTLSTTGCAATTFSSDTPNTGTTLTCSATSAGGTATNSVTIKRDATKPVIQLNGDDPLYLLDNGVPFDDPSATMTDAASGPGPISASNNVNTNTPGVYSREYSGEDQAGNDADLVRGTVDVVHVNLDTTKNAYSIGDNVYVTVIDYLAWRDNTILLVSADIRSLFPDGSTRELISPLRIDRTQGEGVFTNQDPVTLVLNDNCLSEDGDPDTPGIQPTCAEPLLTAVVNDDVQATYITFDTAKARVAENVGGFLGAPPRTTDTVRFAESDSYQLGGSATVKVNDAAANTNSGAINSVTVQIRSTQDTTGFTLTLNEDSINSGTFTGSTAVSFTTGSTTAPAIKANVGDEVTATYGSNVARLTIVSNDNVVFAAGNAIDNTRRDACATDQDGDGICDAWETATGLRIPTTVSGVDYFIPCTSTATITSDPTGITVCPLTTQKDVYLEIDYMLGHAPNNNALNDVTTALKAAPIRGLPGGAINGIVLHRFVGEQTPHQTLMPFTAGSGTSSFTNTKQQFFGTPAERTDPNSNALLTAKRQVFHWAYFGHQQTDDSNSSGLGEKPGNDFWITMGAFTGKQGTQGQQAGTLLHELGHNFGLGHGGGDETNCKGNYLSVMNYLSQFDVPDGGFITGRPLAYSYYKFSDINENALREDVNSITAQSKPTYIGGATGSGASIAPFDPISTNTNTRIDWNRAGGLSTSTTSYAQDTNYFAAVSDCQVKDVNGAPLKSTLTGYNDGANLVYNFRGQSTFDSGAVVVNQKHTTTSTQGIILDEEFQTTIDVPDQYLIQSGIEGTPGFSGSGTYLDPDANTITGSINWGDGSSSSPLTIVPVTDVGADFSFPTHTYVDNGIYTVTITITAIRIDAGGNTFSYDTSITGTFTVQNANPVVISGGPVSLTPGTSSYTLSGASFTDLGINDFLWNVVINWNDGTPNTSQSKSAQGAISATHTYTLGQFVLSNTYNVGISVTDKDLGSGTASKAITVSRLTVGTKLDAAAVSNGLKLNDKGTTLLTILSQPGFDATQVNTSTVKVRANTGLSSPTCSGASVAQSDNTKDQNGDGVKDMLIKVKTSQLCLTLSTNQLITTGSTSSGIQFGSLVSAKVVN